MRRVRSHGLLVLDPSASTGSLRQMLVLRDNFSAELGKSGNHLGINCIEELVPFFCFGSQENLLRSDPQALEGRRVGKDLRGIRNQCLLKVESELPNTQQDQLFDCEQSEVGQ